METFRCPTCLGVLEDPQAHKCAACGQNLDRKKPTVLGEENRITAARLPIDRWMLARLHDSDVISVPSLAWQGKFSTTPMAAPDYAATHSTVEAEIEKTAATADPTLAPEAAVAPGFEAEADVEAEAGLLEPTVTAHALDQYVAPAPTPAPAEAAAPAAPPADPDDEDAAAAAATPPAPTTPKPAPEELDPDVRALVDELYQQARAELSGTDLTFSPSESRDDETGRAPEARAFVQPTGTTNPSSAWTGAYGTEAVRRHHITD